MKQLIEVSQALDFNFFSLYSGSANMQEQTSGHQQRVAALEEEAKKKDQRIGDLEEKVLWAKTVMDALKKR